VTTELKETGIHVSSRQIFNNIGFGQSR
jgi:hypothetical protein